MARRVVRSFCFVLAGSVLAACSIGPWDARQIDPKDNHPPDVMDHVRSLDLMPRFPKNGTAATPNTASPSQPTVFVGAGETTVAEPAQRDAAPNGDGYDLNFENAPVATVAKVILGDILGVGYTIDPRVQGTVTLASGRPVAKSDILYVLENALRLSNVALVRDKGGYRLMPAGDAIGSGAMDKLATAEPGYGITVIPLRYVSAQTIIKLVDGFATKPGAMRADAARNLLILQGSGAERRNRARNRARASTSTGCEANRSASIPIHNSTPEPVITELEKIMDSGEFGARPRHGQVPAGCPHERHPGGEPQAGIPARRGPVDQPSRSVRHRRHQSACLSAALWRCAPCRGPAQPGLPRPHRRRT